MEQKQEKQWTVNPYDHSKRDLTEAMGLDHGEIQELWDQVKGSMTDKNSQALQTFEQLEGVPLRIKLALAFVAGMSYGGGY